VPEYGSGWNIFVNQSGRIDHRYDYLFYEAGLGFVPQLSEGWCVRQEDLKPELTGLLTAIGLNAAEIRDLIDYWRGVLTDTGTTQYIPYSTQPSTGSLNSR
jgi:hypothetical protein